MTLGENFEPLRASPFFQVGFDCNRLSTENPFSEIKEKKFKLPDTSSLLQEESFADLQMGFNEEGLYLLCQVNQPFQDQFYPEVRRGDSLELFIDTRNLKTSSFVHKFCHHFVFLPKEAEGVQAFEATRFRSDDSHELCDPKELKIVTEFGKNSYLLKIFIPVQCLYGYDPIECDRLGFDYQVNRIGGPSQHFSTSSEEFSIEREPSLWSSVKLVDGSRPPRTRR